MARKILSEVRGLLSMVRGEGEVPAALFGRGVSVTLTLSAFRTSRLPPTKLGYVKVNRWGILILETLK